MDDCQHTLDLWKRQEAEKKVRQETFDDQKQAERERKQSNAAGARKAHVNGASKTGFEEGNVQGELPKKGKKPKASGEDVGAASKQYFDEQPGERA